MSIAKSSGTGLTTQADNGPSVNTRKVQAIPRIVHATVRLEMLANHTRTRSTRGTYGTGRLGQDNLHTTVSQSTRPSSRPPQLSPWHCAAQERLPNLCKNASRIHCNPNMDHTGKRGGTARTGLPSSPDFPEQQPILAARCAACQQPRELQAVASEVCELQLPRGKQTPQPPPCTLLLKPFQIPTERVGH